MSLSRRGFLAIASSAVICGPRDVAKACAAPLHRGRLLLGLTSPVYFSGFNPFLNWWKTASSPTLALSTGQTLSREEVWTTKGYLDPETGEILCPAPLNLSAISRVFFKSANEVQVKAGCNYAGEEWTATWEGKARGRIDFLNDNGGKQRGVGLNQIDFVTGADPDSVQLVLDIIDRNEPPRNIRIFQKRYGANIDKGERFNPDWLAEVRSFGVLRFMGWMPTNDETITNFSQLADEQYFAWSQQFISTGTIGAFGSKGSLHPRLICELANETGCNIHVCIPVRATDDFVRQFAEYFKDNTAVEVTYELSNECWNSLFDQFHYCRSNGNKLWPGDFWAAAKWYGFRSAQCMKIIRDVYGDRHRWRGALSTQTVDVKNTLKVFAGVNYWRKKTLKPARSLKVADLFGSLYVTGYFGFSVFGKRITHVTNSPIAACTAVGHSFQNGQRIKLFITDGPTGLNERYYTVFRTSDDTFCLQDTSTVGMGSQLPPCRLATSEALRKAVYYRGEPDKEAILEAVEAGRLVIDGVDLRDGDNLLVKDQNLAEQNGIYRVIRTGNENVSWRLQRAKHFSHASAIVAGSSVQIEQGAAAGNYVLKINVDVVGRDAVIFDKVRSRNYAVDATLFELMDASAKRHLVDPASFPTKFSYFNQQVARALREGSCDTSLTVVESVAALERTFWPPQLSIANAFGLTLRQYEGGCGLAGGGELLGDPTHLVYDGNEQFGEFIFNFGHSQEAAEVYAESYNAFWRIGGEYPAKFVADGRSSNAGTWAGVRFWPLKSNAETGDADNPVWRAVLAANR